MSRNWLRREGRTRFCELASKVPVGEEFVSPSERDGAEASAWRGFDRTLGLGERVVCAGFDAVDFLRSCVVRGMDVLLLLLLSREGEGERVMLSLSLRLFFVGRSSMPTMSTSGSSIDSGVGSAFLFLTLEDVLGGDEGFGSVFIL